MTITPGGLDLQRLTIPLGITCEDDGTGHAVGAGAMPR
jgi:hypothetical protein